MSCGGRFGAAHGCLYAGAAALVTSALLVVNGSLALLLVRFLVPSGSQWASQPNVAQLLLLTIPILLTVVQWILIDRLSRLFSGTHRPHTHRPHTHRH